MSKKKSFFPKEPKPVNPKEAPDLGPAKQYIMIREVIGKNADGHDTVFRMLLPDVAYKALEEIKADLNLDKDYPAVLQSILLAVTMVRGVRHDREARGLKPATSPKDWFQFYETFFVGQAEESEK